MIKIDKKYVSNTFVGIVLVFVLIHIIGWNTDAMKVAIEFVERDNKIHAIIGNVRYIFMVPFATDVKMRNDDGNAKIKLLVVGTKNKSIISMQLEKVSKIWQVTVVNTTYDNKRINIK